jgi:hypothetical protein
MGPSKCAKPAAASEAVNGLRDSKSLASDGNLAQKPHRAQVVTAARNAPPARRQLPAWQYIAAEPRRATYAAVDLMVAELPYGFWKDATGRIVVFNRGYLPIWQRFLNGEIQPANPHEWVSWVEERWFDADRVRFEKTTRERLREILRKFFAGEDLERFTTDDVRRRDL